MIDVSIAAFATYVTQFCNLTSIFLDVQYFQMWNNASQPVCAYCPSAVLWSKLYLDTVYAIIFAPSRHFWDRRR